MSKKSRKRNKKILAAIGLGLGAVALANRKPKQSSTEENSGRDGDGPAAIARANANKKTIPKMARPGLGDQEKKPKIFKPNKSAADDIMRGGSGTKYVDKYAGTPLRRLQKKSVGPSMSGIDDMNDFAAKDGGRAGYKSGGSSVKKSMGKALRGGGKVMR